MKHHKWKINLLCSLGYIYFLLIPFLALVLVGGIITALALLNIHSGLGSLSRYIILPLLILVWLMFKGFFSALATRIPEPEGVEITAENAPGLHGMVQVICQKLGCPPFHSIKLYTDNNAFIAELPTLGLLGRYRRHLMIGVPLLIFLSEQELASVIAHECGHITGSHGREGMRIGRAQMVWERVAEELAKKGKDKYFFISRFLNWYVPALNDVHYRQSRLFELAADQASAAIAGPRAAADSLVKGQYWSSAIEHKFWESIMELNHAQPQPPEDIFVRMRAFVQDWFDPEKADKLIGKIREFRSLPDATHPSPAERIAALGVALPEGDNLRVQTGSIPYDGLAQETVQECSRLFAKLAKAHWEETWKHWQDARARLEELSKKNNNEQLSLEEQIEQAAILGLLNGPDRGIAEMDALLEANPDHPQVLYHKGRYLLEMGNAEGEALLEQAMEGDAQAIPACCEALTEHYEKAGNHDKALEAYWTAVRFMCTNDDVEQERNHLRYSSDFLPHELAYDMLMGIREKLLAYPKITKAYVARIGLQHSGQFPCYIVLYRHRYSKKKAQEMQNELSEAGLLPWDCFVCSLNTVPQFACKIDSIPNSRIL